jgi:hypothetical protein
VVAEQDRRIAETFIKSYGDGVGELLAAGRK